MTQELLDWVNAYLERDEDIIVPVKRMWNEWHAAHGGPPFEEFTRLVLADERVKPERGLDHNDPREEFDTDEEYEAHIRDLESMGFYSGPRVRLKSREITLEHIVRMITKHNDRMEWALEQARKSMPRDISETQEGEVIDITEQARELRRLFREAGLDESEEQDRR